MSDVKWIKITTDIFDDEKILLIESLPEGDSIIVIWFKLLCLAGKTNNSGVFMINDRIAYTDGMLAKIFRRKEATVKLALQTFEQFGMIERIDDIITIPSWGKHQSLDQLEKKKEYQREYMRDYREKQKQLACKTNSKTNSMTNVSLLDIEEEKEEDKNKNRDIEWFTENYHNICVSLPKVRTITDKRKKAIKKLLKNYSKEDIIECFKNVEDSSFLKGNNDRGWKADIDFILREDKFIAILEGKYTDSKSKKKRFNLEGNTDPYTEEDKIEDDKWREEMKKRGIKTSF